MKKILNTALIAIVFSAMMVDTLRAKYVSDGGAGAGAAMEETVTTPRRRGRRAPARRGRRGKVNNAAALRRKASALQVAINTINTTDNPAVKEEAKKTANALAQEVLAGIQDERTWLQDIGVSKYSPEQIANATAKLAELIVRKEDIEKEIKSKKEQLEGMSARRLVFWSKAAEGREDEHKRLSQELADLNVTLKDLNKAIRNQAIIAGKEYSATVRGALTVLASATLAGVAYGVDSYFELGYGEAGKQKIAKMQKDIETAGGYGAYFKGTAVATWESVSKAVNMGVEKLDDLKDTVFSVFSTNSKLTMLAKKATRAQEEAVRLLDIAEESKDPKDIEAAAKQQAEADKLGADLEAAVATANTKASK